MPISDAGVLSRLQCFSGAHSRVLQPGVPIFSVQIGAVDLRPHCPRHRRQPSPGAEPRSRWPDWISAWARTVRTMRTVVSRASLARRKAGLS